MKGWLEMISTRKGHTFNVPSRPTLSRAVQSGKNAPTKTASVWPMSEARFLTGYRIPEPKGAILTGGGDRLVVRCEGDAVDWLRMPL